MLSHSPAAFRQMRDQLPAPPPGPLQCSGVVNIGFISFVACSQSYSDPHPKYNPSFKKCGSIFFLGTATLYQIAPQKGGAGYCNYTAILLHDECVYTGHAKLRSAPPALRVLARGLWSCFFLIWRGALARRDQCLWMVICCSRPHAPRSNPSFMGACVAKHMRHREGAPWPEPLEPPKWRLQTMAFLWSLERMSHRSYWRSRGQNEGG